MVRNHFEQDRHSHRLLVSYPNKSVGSETYMRPVPNSRWPRNLSASRQLPYYQWIGCLVPILRAHNLPTKVCGTGGRVAIPPFCKFQFAMRANAEILHVAFSRAAELARTRAKENMFAIEAEVIQNHAARTYKHRSPRIHFPQRETFLPSTPSHIQHRSISPLPL